MNFYFEGCQQIQLIIAGRENGDLAVAATYSGVPLNLHMNETHISRGFYSCIFQGTGNSAQLWQNLGMSGDGGSLKPVNPLPPIRYDTGTDLNHRYNLKLQPHKRLDVLTL
jgi:hypothetical protein